MIAATVTGCGSILGRASEGIGLIRRSNGTLTSRAALKPDLAGPRMLGSGRSGTTEPPAAPGARFANPPGPGALRRPVAEAEAMADRTRRATGLLVLVAACLGAVPGRAREQGPERARFEALAQAAPDLDPGVLQRALGAASCAERRGLLDDPDILTVIDYTRPSTEPRLFVLDVAAPALLHEELVAHGRGTGENEARRFSNEPGSLQSSLGLFVTRGTYVGRHGRSLKLLGLEPGVNDRALERAIVLHGAKYVSETFAGLHGRLGRSFGCPALSVEVAQRVIDVIRGGTPVFAWYPDRAWLASSTFLGACEEPRAQDPAPGTAAR